MEVTNTFHIYKCRLWFALLWQQPIMTLISSHHSTELLWCMWNQYIICGPLAADMRRLRTGRWHCPALAMIFFPFMPHVRDSCVTQIFTKKKKENAWFWNLCLVLFLSFLVLMSNYKIHLSLAFWCCERTNLLSCSWIWQEIATTLLFLHSFPWHIHWNTLICLYPCTL